MKQENFSAKTVNDFFETIAEVTRRTNQLYNKDEQEYEDQINF